jgi:hypothetical protein
MGPIPGGGAMSVINEANPGSRTVWSRKLRHDVDAGREGSAVKRSKLADEQIAFSAEQPEVGTAVEQVCRKMGISDATYCNG